MADRTVYLAYFSPAGTTRRSVERVGAGLGPVEAAWDLVEQPPEGEIVIPKDGILVAGAPVYAGRIPAIGAQRLSTLRGDNTPAVALAVYGNRAYEDALLELRDLLEARGFRVIGAAAVVAQHSIFPNTAHGRPDGADLEKLDAFAASCARKAAAFQGEAPLLTVPGDSPYRKPMGVPFRPTADGSCTGCGACARVCPAGAIDPARPRESDKDKCIACAACIRVCPAHARAFRGPVYAAAEKGFALKCRARREPEFFC